MAILAIILVVAGGITVETTSLKVAKTAVSLYVISDNIDYYNSLYIKTDEATREIEEQFKERRENFYESDDFVVRTYSNMFILLKLLFFLLAIAAIPVTPIVCLILLYREIYILRKRMRVTRKICRAYERSRFAGSVIEFEKYMRHKKKTSQAVIG